MVSSPIMVFFDWRKEFCMHFYASYIMLGVLLAQLGEGYVDHPIAFASRKLSATEKNYTTSGREGISMVYSLHNCYHYLLGGTFQDVYEPFCIEVFGQ